MNRANSFRSSFGYSLLEQAIALPVLLIFIVGIIDANNVIQGYNAIRKGVSATVRCLYPTDGECVSVSEDTRTRLFSVTQVTREPQSFGSVVDYSGRSSWFDVPKNTYDSARVSVLTSVVYRAPQQQFDARQNLKSDPTGFVPYKIRKYTVPYLSGTQSDVNFGTQDINGHRGDYPDTGIVEVDVGNVGGSTSTVYRDDDDGKSIGESEWIKLENPYSVPVPELGRTFHDVPCFDATNVNGGVNDPSPANFSSNCKADETNIVIWATGHIGTNLNAATGKVVFSLEIEDGPPNKPIRRRFLGGRLLRMKAGESDDFLPRGFLPVKNGINGEPDCKDKKTQPSNDPIDSYQRVDDSLVDACHAKLHANITVPWGKRFRFAFKIQSDNGGEVEWHADKFIIGKPVFIDEVDPVICAGTYPASQVLNTAPCKTSHPAGDAVGIDVNSGHYSSAMQALPCEVSDITSGENYINANFPFPDSYELIPSKAVSCGNVIRNHACPDNYGHSSMPPENGAWFLDAGVGKAICPIVDEDLAQRGIEPIDPAWAVGTKDIGITPIEWTPPDCSQLEPPRSLYPPELLRYSHFNLNAPSKTEIVELHTLPISSELSPTKLKELPQYACSEFDDQEKTYDRPAKSSEESKEWLPANSIFAGFRRDLGCGYEEVLRSAASDELLGAHRLLSDVYFEGKITARQEVPLTGDGPQVSDECTYVRYDDSKIIAEENLGTYPENMIPAFCKANPSECRINFAGFEGGLAPDIRHDATLAISRYGIPAVQNFFPRARFMDGDCSGDYCAKIEELNKSDLAREHVTMVGRINVPTYLLSVFGKDHFQVTYRAQERYEQNLAH